MRQHVVLWMFRRWEVVVVVVELLFLVQAEACVNDAHYLLREGCSPLQQQSMPRGVKCHVIFSKHSSSGDG